MKPAPISLTCESAAQQFKTALAQLRGQDGFAKPWKLQTTKPSGKSRLWACIQLSKDHWFNEDSMGIHIETRIAEREAGKVRLPFQLHVLHLSHFPGTRVKAGEFHKRWRELEGPAKLISGWKGYKAGRVKHCSGTARFAPLDIATAVVEEFARLHMLGTYIDDILEEILPQEDGRAT